MPIPVYQARLSRCRAAMTERGVGALLLTPGAAMRYMIGFSEEGYERLLCLVIPNVGPVTLLVPSLNAEQARANPAGVSAVYSWGDEDGWQAEFGRLAAELGLNFGAVAVDDGMPARFVLPLQEMLPNASLRSAGHVFVDLRSVKDDAEIAAMRRAAAATDAAYRAALAVCRPAVTEVEIAATILAAIRGSGAEPAFQPIVGAGPNSAMPHHTAGARQVREGEIVLLDLGAKVDGYCGDITRVLSMGAPDPDAARIYDLVYKAYSAGVAAARPGVSAETVDRAARQVITDAGYGDMFFHRTGHGIGMEDHEAPNIVAGNRSLLQPGNCFSVEPGVYLTGRFGIRLENILTITPSGCEVLNERIPSALTDIADLRRL